MRAKQRRCLNSKQTQWKCICACKQQVSVCECTCVNAFNFTLCVLLLIVIQRFKLVITCQNNNYLLSLDFCLSLEKCGWGTFQRSRRRKNIYGPHRFDSDGNRTPSHHTTDSVTAICHSGWRRPTNEKKWAHEKPINNGDSRFQLCAIDCSATVTPTQAWLAWCKEREDCAKWK